MIYEWGLGDADRTGRAPGRRHMDILDLDATTTNDTNSYIQLYQFFTSCVHLFVYISLYNMYLVSRISNRYLAVS